MKVGIVGYAGSGKSAVFQWLTGAKPDPAKAQMGQTGVAKVPDPRLDLLSARFQPKKTTLTALEFLDTPGLIPDERRDNPRRLGILRESNGLLVVLNGFSEADPAKQLHRFREELMFADLEIVTGRIGRLEDQLKKPRPAKLKEQDEIELGLLQRIAAAFEANQTPVSLGFKEDEEKAIRSFQLLTLKPEFVLLNIGDDKVKQPVPPDLSALSPTALQAPAKLEMELADLPDEDRQMFMQDPRRDGVRARRRAAGGVRGDGPDRVPDGRLRRVPGVGDAGRRRRRGGREPDSHRPGARLRAGRGAGLGRLRQAVRRRQGPGRRVDEGGPHRRTVASGGEDVRGQRWGHYAHFGEHIGGYIPGGRGTLRMRQIPRTVPRLILGCLGTGD